MSSAKLPSAKIIELLTSLGVLSPTRPLLFALEPRIAFDAAAVAVVAEAEAAGQAADAGPSAEAQSAGPQDNGAYAALTDALLASDSAPPAQSTTVVFIDSAIQDAATLANAAQPGAEIVMLSNSSDGLTQIAQYLNGRTGIESIHILSHGEQGELRLGNATVHLGSLTGEHADELATIRAALTDDADILFYGCNVADGTEGQAFIAALAEATGADIAASTDDTGHTDLGGDWVLETRQGDIDTASLAATDWNGVLAPLVINASGIQPSIDFPTPANVGQTAVWARAGTIGGTVVDLHATVVSKSAGTTVYFDTSGDDPEVDVETNASTTSGEVLIRWEIFQTGTTIRAIGDPSITISDVDGNGAPFTIETVIPALDGLRSVTTGATTDIFLEAQNGELTASGTRRDDGVPSSSPVFASGGATRDAAAVTFNWTNRSSWEVAYRVDTANALRVFLHDGDGDFRFAGATTTTTFTQIDLDANNSSGATDADYRGTYTLGSAGVSIGDAVGGDVAVTADAGVNIASARITLSNAQSGDTLSIAGSAGNTGTVPGTTITYAISGSTVTLSGTATPAAYETALEAIRFANASTSASTADRVFSVDLTDQRGFGTNIATATLSVAAPAVDTDADGVADATDIDDDNDGILDTVEIADATQTITFDQISAIPAGTYPGNPAGMRVSDATGQYAVDIFVNTAAGSVTGQHITFDLATGRIGNGTEVINDGEIAVLTYTTANSPTPWQLSSVTINDINSLSAFGSGVRDSYAWSETGTWTPIGSPAGAVYNVNTGAANGVGTLAIADPDGSEGEVINFANELLATTGGQQTSQVLNNPRGNANGHTARIDFDAPHTSVDLYIFDALHNQNGGMLWNFFPQFTAEIPVDTDGDGLANHLDIDSDDDGITDNIEAQTTDGYIAPSGVGAAMVDANNDGLDDVYDAGALGAAGGIGLTPVNTDGTDAPDYLDTDTDNDDLTDRAENGLGVAQPAVNAADTDNDGLKDVYETAIDGNASDGFVVNEGELPLPASTTGYLPDFGDAVAGSIVPLSADLNYRDTSADPAPSLDLDADDSSGTVGTGYQTTFTENGASVYIADLDAVVTSAAGTLASATITLTNGKIGDVLQVGLLPAGIEIVGAEPAVLTANGTITLALTGTASAADYQAAINAIAFANLSEAPDTVTRAITIVVNNGETNSGAVTSFVEVIEVNDAPTAQIGIPFGAIGANDLVVIDLGAPNATDIVARLPDGVEFVTIDAATDGVAQLAAYLTGRTDIAAIHILSHGDASALYLGSSTLDATSITGTHAANLAIIGSALSGTGDILIYGCNFGQDLAAVTALANATGADIAASSDNTGSADLGGDWTLETTVGSIETSAIDVLGWQGLLVPQNTGAWTISSITATQGAPVTATNTTAGITTTVTFAPQGSDTRFASISNGTFNTISAFSNGADGDPSLSFVYDWDTSPGSATSEASVDSQAGFITITFSQPVNNPILHLDRIGGQAGNLHNGATLTLLTSGITLSKVGGPSHFLVDSAGGTIGRSGIDTRVGTGYSAESSLNGATGTAAGSVQLNGTFSTVQFRLTPAPGSNEGSGGDGIELGLTLNINTVPSATVPNYTTPEDTPVVISGVSFADVDAGTGNVTVTLSVSSGTLDMNTAVPGGVTAAQVSGDNSGTITITAPLAAINTTLANASGLTFQPALDFNGTVPFTATINDLGNGDAGITPLTATTNATITVTPVNDPLTLTGLDNGPAGSGTDAEVQESDLAIGSTPTDTGETAAGTFTIQPGDGLTSLQVGATTITAAQLAAATAAAPVNVTGTNGTLSITGYDPIAGVVTYGYTLTTPADHTGGSVTDPFAITLTDIDGDTATGTLAILIADDVPAAVNDTATVTEDAATTATGNVVTSNDTVGADVTTTPITGIVAGSGSPAGTSANVGSSVTGTYGTLTLSVDGTYSYVLNNSSDAIQGLAQGETVNDVFTYEITDADGDTSTATLTVAIVGANDAPVVIDPNNPGTPENPNPAPNPLNIIPDIVTVDSATPSTVDISDYIVDPDGDTLTFTSSALPPGLTLVNGIISGTLSPDASQGGPNGDGVYPITITATDSNGATTTTTITYTVTNPAPVAVIDTASVTEDTPLNGFVITNDSDPDGDDLLVTAFTIDGIPGVTPAGGSATIPGVGAILINQDGSFTFTPALNYAGPVPVITYTISDGEGGTDTADLILTMIPVNDPPVAVDDTVAVAEDTPASGNVIGNDTDPDGDPLTVVEYAVDGLPGPIPAGTPVLIPDVGTLFVDPNGAFTFTPIENYTGPIPAVTYTVTDNNGETDQGVLTLTIAPANDPPVAVDDTATVTEDTPATGNVLADGTDDSDLDGDTLTVTGFTVDGFPGPYAPGATATIPGVGTLVIEADGNYTFTPAANYDGPIPAVTYTIADGNGGTDTGALALTMVPANDPGAITDTISNVGNVAGSDAEVREADLATGTNPTGTAEATTGSFTIADIDGIASLTVGGTTIPLAALTAATPSAPVTIASPAYGTIAITGFDPDTGVVSYTYTQDTNAPNVAGAPALDTIALTLTDTLGNSVPGTLAIAILDDAPIANADVDRVISTAGNPSSTAIGNVVTGVPSAGDPNTSDGTADTAGADGFAASPVTGVAPGSDAPDAANLGLPIPGIYGSLTMQPNGNYIYTPNFADPAVAALGPDQSLSDVFTYQVTDADGSTSTTTLTVSITGTPAIISAGSASPTGVDGTVEESDLLTGTTPAGSGETITGSFVAVVSAPDTIATVTIAGTDYTPAQLLAATPTAPITITTPDGVLEISGFNATTGRVSYAYTLSTAQDHSGGAVFDEIPVSVTSNLGDVGNGTLRFEIADDAPLAGNDLDEVSEDGTTPATGNVFTGLDVASGDTNALDGSADTLGADAVAAPITAVGAGTGVPTNGVGTPISGTYGTLTLNSDGSYSYAPNTADPDVNGLDAGESLNDVFTYVVSDADGDTVTATLTVTIIGANDSPVVIDPANPGVPGSPTPATDPANIIPDVTTIDSAIPPTVVVSDYFRDPEGKPLTFDATGLPPGLTIDPVTGHITGTLPPDASQGGPNNDGIYTVTVAVTDAGGLTTTTEITYTVTNPPPVALDDVDSVGEDDASITGNVITDLGLDNDPDKDPITVTLADQAGSPISIGQPFTTAGGGILTLNADGSYTFEPGTAYNGLKAGETAMEVITYTIDDGEDGTDQATLTITIVGANDAPVVIDPSNPGTPENPIPATDPLNIIPDVARTDGQPLDPILVGDFVRDPDGEPLTFSVDPATPTWVVIDPVTGTITGTPPANASQLTNTGTPGEYLITITATDPDGAVATTTVTLAITNLPPVATDDADSVGEDDASVSGSVLPNDADTAPDSDPLTVVSALEGTTPLTIGAPFTTAGGGTLTLNADGSYTFEPGTAYNGLDVTETATETITYTVSDGNGGTDEAMLVITINGANDAPVVIDPANPGTPENPIPATDPLNIIPDVNRTDGEPLDPILVGDFVRDPDGEPLTFTVDPATPTWIVIDPVTGTITGTPPANASQLTNTGTPGEYLITITATDPQGATTTTTVTLSITNVPPVAQDDVGTTGENTPLSGNVLADNGSGPDADGGTDTDPVRVGGVVTGTGIPVEGVGLATPVAGDQGGAFTVQANGAYVFEPGTAFDDLAPGETRTTMVTYVIFDDNGDSDTATLTVTVTGTNDAPTVIDPLTGLPPVDPATGLPIDPAVTSVIPPITGDDSAPITPVSISRYFGDVDTSQGPPALTLDQTALPPGISFDPATGTFSGTPAADASQGGNVPGQPGVYRVPVTATDPEGATVTTFVTFTIANPPPVAVNDIGIVTDENVGVTFPVLDNDSNPDGDPIRVVSASSPNGTVIVNPDGTLTFAPNPGFAGTALVTYTITDDQGGFSTAVAEVFVRATGFVAPPAAPAPLVDPLAPLVLSDSNSIQVRGAVIEESQRIVRLFENEQERRALTSGDVFRIDTLSGSSLQFGFADGRDASAASNFVRTEVFLKNGQVSIILANLAARSGTQVTEYRVTMADGRAVPDWLEWVAFDQLQGKHVPNVEEIDIRVQAILSDGRIVEKDMRIDLRTGEILPLKIKRADLHPLFDEQLRRFAHLDDYAVDALGAALASAAHGMQ